MTPSQLLAAAGTGRWRREGGRREGGGGERERGRKGRKRQDSGGESVRDLVVLFF